MHRKLWVARYLLLGLLFLFPCLLFAESRKGKFLLIPKAGAALTLGDFGESHNTGFHAQSDLEYFLANGISIGVGAAFSQHNLDEGPVRVGELGDTISQSGGKTEIFPFTFKVKFWAPLAGKIKPFVEAGPVFYVTKDVIGHSGAGREMGTATAVSTRGGYTVGFGLVVAVNPRFSLLAAMAYNRILDSDFPFGYAIVDGGLAFLL